MKKQRQVELTEAAAREKTEQEIFNFHKQLSEHWEKAGNLWSQVDGHRLESQKAYVKAANELEDACTILEKAATARKLRLAVMERSEVEGDPDEER